MRKPLKVVLLFLLTAILVVMLGLLAYVAYEVFVPHAPSQAVLVTLPRGTSTPEMARLLEEKNVIGNPWIFDALHLIKKGTLKAGVYRFVEPATVLTVYERIRMGDVYTISVTIPEGANIFDIATRLAEKKLCTEQDFLSVAEHDTALIHGLDPAAPSLEGYLFPDTYHFSPGITAAGIARTMVDQFRAEIKQLGPLRAEATPGLTGEQPELHEIVTLASLIERETPIPSERYLVASVFYNRLAQNMPLMTDPSVIYAAELAHRYHGAIYESDLKFDSPYNTYLHKGLPPGPISNPGLASLKAALHPAQSSYLYFVAATANPLGHSLFSSTLVEHNKNVAAYRLALREAQKH